MIKRNQRGAALILTVVVIMVLTTLGLAMVGFSTTEERTATSYRDGLQARATAEAGIRLAEEMFRNPSNRGMVPLFSSTASVCSAGNADYCGTDEASTETSLHTKGIWRASRSPISPARYTGSGNAFFVGPFGGDWGQTFGGTYSSTAASDLYDLKFNCTDPSNSATVVTAANCWLDSQFNALLQTSSRLESDHRQDHGYLVLRTAHRRRKDIRHLYRSRHSGEDRCEWRHRRARSHGSRHRRRAAETCSSRQRRHPLQDESRRDVRRRLREHSCERRCHRRFDQRRHGADGHRYRSDHGRQR